ncbi:MAG: ATP-binding cassette domain-containing protein [Spirochaetaceae bacterium]
MINSTPPLLSMKKLLFTYRKSSDTNFSLCIDKLDIPAGDVTVLIGQNGSGKTTLLKIMNALHNYREGSFTYRGRSVPGEGSRSLREESILVHQNPYIFRDTAFGNIAYSLKIRGGEYKKLDKKKLDKKEIRQKVMEQLSEVGLTHLAQRKARSLSGGEKQRLAVARALVTDPALLLLDEPTGNIDPASALVVENTIRKRASSGTTVIMTTHNLASAYRMGNTIISLDKGRQVDLGVNVLKGKAEKRDNYFLYFRTGNALLHCPAIDGDFSVAVIPTDDIIITKKKISTSAQNKLRGTVTTISRPILSAQDSSKDRGLYKITLDCGVPLDILLTSRSIEELNIQVGSEYFALFKASAVRLY